jgi:putative membrane protein
MTFTLAALHPVTDISLARWTVHPSTVLGLAALGALYAWRARRLAGGAGAPSGPRRLAFFAALFSVFLALNGPLHDLSDVYLFSAHMLQHLVLTLVFPSLLLLGLTDGMLRPLLEAPVIGAALRRATRPVWCFAIFNLVLAAWHLPPLYNLAMRYHAVHITQHLMFMAASVLMWWPLLSPVPSLPRLPYAGQMLYCFLMSIPMSIVSVCIVYAGNVLYPAYASAPRIAGLSPLEDQRVGGLIMWIPGGLFFVVLMTVIFFRWASRYDAEGAGGVEDGRLATR